VQLLPSSSQNPSDYTPSKSGQWWSLGNSPSGTAIYGEGGFYCSHVPIFKQITLSAIGAEITVAGTAGAVIRLGVYRARPNCADVDLVSDLGTIDGTVAAFQSIPTSLTLPPALYVFGGAVQGGAATRPTVRFGINYNESMYVTKSSPGAGSPVVGGFFLALGALPASATVAPDTSCLFMQVQFA